MDDLEQSLEILRHGARLDPVALLAACLGEVVRIRRHKPEQLSVALKFYAAVADLVRCNL